MTEAEWLYVILAALYASECVFIIRRDAIVLASVLGIRWRQARVHCPASGADWGLVIDSPLPLGTTIATGDWPISFGGAGALAYVARCKCPQGRIRQTGRWLRYEEVGTAVCEGRSVVVDGRLLAEAPSERDAERCCELLVHLRELPAAERPAAIRAALDQTLSIEAVDSRLGELRAAIFLSRQAAVILVAVIFGGGAALLWSWAGILYWPLLLVLLIVGHVAAVIGLFRGVRKLGLRRVEGMTKHLITAILSPLGAARGPALIARHALDGFHPLACAVTLLPRPRWSELARRWLRDLRHPLEPACDHPEEAARGAEAEYRELVGDALTALLAKFDWHEAAECAPPEREDGACQAYCPRCLAQFTSREVVCPNCGGLATVAFAEETRVAGDER